MRNLQHSCRSPQALPLWVDTLYQSHIYSTTGLLTLHYAVTAAIFAFIRLSAQTVFTVLHDVCALATMAMTKFYYHVAKM